MGIIYPSYWGFQSVLFMYQLGREIGILLKQVKKKKKKNRVRWVTIVSPEGQEKKWAGPLQAVLGRRKASHQNFMRKSQHSIGLLYIYMDILLFCQNVDWVQNILVLVSFLFLLFSIEKIVYTTVWFNFVCHLNLTYHTVSACL